VGVGLFQAERQTDRQTHVAKLILAFGNFRTPFNIHKQVHEKKLKSHIFFVQNLRDLYSVTRLQRRELSASFHNTLWQDVGKGHILGTKAGNSVARRV